VIQTRKNPSPERAKYNSEAVQPLDERAKYTSEVVKPLAKSVCIPTKIL